MKKHFLIKGGIKMAEISAINNFKKYNSGSGRSSINNVVKEAFRELEKSSLIYSTFFLNCIDVKHLLQKYIKKIFLS